MGFEFNYHTAFDRNIGWVTTAELDVLRDKRVAIAGLGGVGGSHTLTLTRLGIGAFNLADLDTFELANFNRQAGASVTSLGQAKTDTLAALARGINPELDIRLFPTGINDENMDAFLEDADVYVDGLDFFALQARRAVFAACAQRGIPAITAAPLGMGAAMLVFMPGGISFEDYFQLEGQPEEEQLLRLLLGLSPTMQQTRYLADPSAVDFINRRTPSTTMGCELCAGMAATQVLKILLHRGEVIRAPRGLHFDAYRNQLARTWRPGGNRHPLQRLALHIGRRQLRKMFQTPADSSPPQPGQHAGDANTTPASAPRTASRLAQILDKARWAPSGDNSQPWRFEIVDDTHLVVHGFDTRAHCVYDRQGHASQLSLGALLETLDIAASVHRLHTRVQRRPDAPEQAPVFDIEFVEETRTEQGEQASPTANRIQSTLALRRPLAAYIPLRSVQRRRLSTRALTRREKTALEQAVGEDYAIHWFEGLGQRWRMATLLFNNAGLRLTLPEAYETHRDIIDWDTTSSETRIPAPALGASALTLRLMRWALTRWERVRFMNRYLAGTLAPRLEMDLLPALACAAHFVIMAKQAPRTLDDYVAAGRATQRFWLTAARLGLQLQPAYTPLVFHEYVRDAVPFTADAHKRRHATRVAAALAERLGAGEVDRAVFLGRIGQGAVATSRSVRKPLAELMASPPVSRDTA